MSIINNPSIGEALRSRLSPNPIIVKELRSRMRGGRAFVTLTITLLFLAAFSYAIYRITMVTSQYSSTPLSPMVGQTVFAGLIFLELVMICAITPAVTAGAISGEKEKLTYEMLLVTPLHPARVLWGKLVSALSYVFLQIFAGIPMASLVFIFGGVTLRDMFKALAVLGVLAVMIGVIGLFMSALLGRTGRATAATYVVVLLLTFGPIFLAAGTGMLRQIEPPRGFLFPSPISAVASAMTPSVNPGNMFGSFLIGSFYWIWGTNEIGFTSIPRPLYHYSLAAYGAITIVLYLITTRLVLPTRRWRIHWAEAVAALVILLGYAGVVAAGYAVTSGRYENISLVATATPMPAMVVPPPNLNVAPVQSDEISNPYIAPEGDIQPPVDAPADNKIPPTQALPDQVLGTATPVPPGDLLPSPTPQSSDSSSPDTGVSSP
jgi:ABC-type transport system involved in multi-copper enzyme maturation permease subunit